jgi:hypothetical protein
MTPESHSTSNILINLKVADFGHLDPLHRSPLHGVQKCLGEDPLSKTSLDIVALLVLLFAKSVAPDTGSSVF